MDGHLNPPSLENSAGRENEPALPCWVEDNEVERTSATMLSLHTQPCADFQTLQVAHGWGGQQNNRSTGRSRCRRPQCALFHFDAQRRRAPVDESTGQLMYWDMPCSNDPEGHMCPQGDACIFAHSRGEISYHPAKYKTRLCKFSVCKGEEVCCFAHNEGELRSWAPARYSIAERMGCSLLSCSWSRNVPAVVPRSLGSTAAGAEGLPAPHPVPESLGGGLYHPNKFKHRFCASYPNVSQCRRGETCAFAHSREECRSTLLDESEENKNPAALTDEFFMYKFKIHWCPIGVQHDWQNCVYAHNFQDVRRTVSIGYGPRPCPYYKRKETCSEYAQRCPLGLRCPYSHGAKEQLYHPQYFRSVVCRDVRGKPCPRSELCAFYHPRMERRSAPVDKTNYDQPLPQKNLPDDWVHNFLSQPFFPDKGDPADEEAMQMALAPKVSRFFAGRPRPGEFYGGDHLASFGHSGNFSGAGWPQTMPFAEESGELTSKTPSTSASGGSGSSSEDNNNAQQGGYYAHQPSSEEFKALDASDVYGMGPYNPAMFSGGGFGYGGDTGYFGGACAAGRFAEGPFSYWG